MWRSILFVLALAGRALAAGPDEVSYQGLVLNDEGTPQSGQVDLQLRVWSDPTSTEASSLLYVEDHFGVELTKGVFSVPLGGGAAVLGSFDPGLFAAGDRWLETVVDGEPLAPRTQFLSVPYALQARQAEFLSGLSGAVLHFALPECPPGWSEFAPARGRTLLGLPTGGTLEGTSGTPLGNLESRQHTHAVSTPAAGTTFVGQHAHTVPTGSTFTDTHNHRWSRWNGSARDWRSFNSSGGEFTITDWNDGMDSVGAGIYPIAASTSGSTTIYTDRDSHNHLVNSVNTAGGGSHNHTVAASQVTSAAAGSGPTLPYVQLLVCVKD